MELSQQISDLVVTKKTPLLILFLLNLSDLTLDFMCTNIILLFGKLLLHFSQIDDLTGFSFSCWDGLLNNFFKLGALSLMLLQCLTFYLFGFRLVLNKLCIPIFVEFSHLLVMGCLNLLPLLFKSTNQFNSSLLLQLCLHLHQSLLDCFSFKILPCFLAGLLVSEEDLP